MPIDIDMKVFQFGPTTAQIPRGRTLKLHDAFFLLEGSTVRVYGHIETDDGAWVEKILEVSSRSDAG